MSEILKRSESGIETTIEKIKFHSYLKYTSSISSLVHGNSKLVSIIITIIREMQILAFLLDEKVKKKINIFKFSRYWSIKKTNLLHKFKIIFNPGLVYKEDNPTLKNSFEYMILCWILISLLRSLIKIIFTDSHSKQAKKNQKKLKYDAFEVFINYNLLSIPMCTFFFGKIKTEKIDGIIFASIFIVALFLFKTFLGVLADYDRRIFQTGFGCNFVFLIHIGVVILFNYFYLGVNDLNLSLIILGGLLACFVVKILSDQYICLRTRIIDVSLSGVSFWISLVLTSSIMTAYYRKDSSYFIIMNMSVLLLILRLVFRSSNIKRVLSLTEEKEFVSLEKIELLLYLSKHREYFSDEDQLLIYDAIHVYSSKEGDEEDLDSLKIHPEDKTSRNMSHQTFIETVMGEDDHQILAEKRIAKRLSHMNSINRLHKLTEENFRLTEFYEFIYEKYQQALKYTIEDFSLNFEVKISLAYFLHDFMDLTNESQFHFIQASLTKELKAEHEIDLERFKDLTVDDVEENKKKLNMLDIKGREVINNLHQLLEQANTQYGVLWLNLLEENPSITKIRDSLLKSQKKIKHLKKFWNRNFEIVSSNICSLTLYGIFLKNVLNEKEQAKEITIKGRNILRNMIIERNKLTNLDRNEDITTMADPVCVITRSDDELYVKSCNHQFSFLLGYQKGEMRGRPWKKFIFEESVPFYRKKLGLDSIEEDEASEEFFSLIEEQETDQLPFVNKLGFLRIFQVDLIVTRKKKKPRNLVMRIHGRKYLRPEAYILTDLDLNIVNHNEMFSWFFRLKNLKFEENEIKSLKEVAKEFKEMNIVDYYKGEEFMLYDPGKKKFDDFYLKIERTIDYNQFLIFSFVRKKDVQKLTLKQKLNRRLRRSKTLKKAELPKGIKNQFIFFINEKIEYEAIMIMRSSTLKEIKTQKLSLLNCKELEKIKKYSSKLEIKKLFSKGIRTKRLFNGDLREVSEFEVAEFTDEFSEYSFSQDGNTQRSKNFSKTNINNSTKKKHRRKNIILKESKTEKIKYKRVRNNFSKKSRTNSKIIHLRIFSFLLLIVTFALFYVNYIRLETTVEDLNNYIKINSLCQSRNEKVKFMYQRIFDIAATNEGIYPFHQFQKYYTKENFLEENYERFLIDAKDMDYYQKVLFELYDKVGARDELGKFTSEHVIKIELQHDNFMKSFVEFFQMAKTIAAKIKSTDVHFLGFQNLDVEFIQRNFIEKISTLSTKLRKFLQVKLEGVRADYVEFKDNFLTVFTIRSILVTIILIFLYRQILKEKHQRLECFISFKNLYIGEMWEKIEEFHLIFQLGKQEDYEYLEEKIDNEYDLEEKEEREFHKKQLKLSGKKHISGKIHSILNFFNLFILIVMGFNYGSMLIDFNFHDGLTKDLAEMAVTAVQFSRGVNKCHFMVLSMSEMLLHPKAKKLNQHPVSYYSVPHLAFIKLYGLSLEAVVEISQTDEIYREKYLELFGRSRCGDDAPAFVHKEDEEFKVKCDMIYDGILKQSFLTALSLYETRLQTLYERYSAIILNQEDKIMKFGGNCQNFPNEKNSTKQSLKCLFTSKLMFEISKNFLLKSLELFQTQYFYPTVTKINMEAIKSSERKMEYIDRVSAMLMGVFLLSEISIVLVLLVLSCKSETEVIYIIFTL